MNTPPLLEQLLSISPDPVIIADLQGRLLEFNAAAETILGYPREDALRYLLVEDIYEDPLVARRTMTALRQSPDGRLRSQRVRLRAQDGTSIPVLLNVAMVSAPSNEAFATIGIFRDCREKEQLSRRLKKATRSLIEAEQRGASELAGAASHNLNQPLTAILGSLELLQFREDLPAEVRRRLEDLYGHVERMARSVRELSKPDAAGENPRRLVQDPTTEFAPEFTKMRR